MKTTIDLPDELLERGKRLARKEGVTLRAVIEEGLHLALRARERRARKPFRLHTFAGDGLTHEFQGAGWDRIRDEIYRDRG
ncbi:MAG: CopG family transcriptional regulator [Rubrivivax sp.]